MGKKDVRPVDLGLNRAPRRSASRSILSYVITGNAPDAHLTLADYDKVQIELDARLREASEKRRTGQISDLRV